MVADDAPQFRAETVAEFGQAFARAPEGCIVAHANELGVAGIIAIGDNNVGRVGSGQKVIEEMIVGERVAQPDVVAINLDRTAEQGIGNDARFMTAALLFRLTRVMNVADDQDRSCLRHGGGIVRETSG